MFSLCYPYTQHERIKTNFDDANQVIECETSKRRNIEGRFSKPGEDNKERKLHKCITGKIDKLSKILVWSFESLNLKKIK